LIIKEAVPDRPVMFPGRLPVRIAKLEEIKMAEHKIAVGYPGVPDHISLRDLLLQIIEEMLVEKAVLTPDLGGTATTQDVGDEVVRKLRD